MTHLVDINGGCHCGNVRFVLRWPENVTQIPRRCCGCTFCRKHGGAWTSNNRAEVRLLVDDESQVSKYRFGTATADFHVCSVCGIVPIVISEIEGQSYAVVNVNTFDDTPGFSFSGTATDFDGEDAGSRLERRQRNWIPTVFYYE